MRYAVVEGGEIQGHVPHHAGHIIGWTGGENPQPIYCSGHDVSGQITSAGQSRFRIEGKSAVIDGATGPSNDPCDGSSFRVSGGLSFMRIGGTPMAASGDDIDLNPGSGTITNPGQNKFRIWR